MIVSVFATLALATMQDVPAPVSEQDTIAEAPVEAVNIIIVVGERGEEQRRIIVGSRIPRAPLFTDLSMATNTGLQGLTPGSGMDGASGNFVRTISKKSCTSDDPGIGQSAACFMAGALKAEGEGDVRFAFAALNSMALADNFTAHERLAAARHFYRIAEKTGDPETRLAGLALMIGIGGLPFSEELAIRRTMIAIALKADNHERARELLGELVERDPTDARSFANLAILQRDARIKDATATMARAIAAREAGGDDVPQGWRDFLRPAAGAGEGGG